MTPTLSARSPRCSVWISFFAACASSVILERLSAICAARSRRRRAWRRRSRRAAGSPYFHLCEIRLDGSGMRQLTDGPYHDVEPTYLPDGGIMFSSGRCRRFVNCHRTPVATLYRCDGDGRNARMISANIEHDNTPWVLPDGRIMYQRWEYIDRSQVTSIGELKFGQHACRWRRQIDPDQHGGIGQQGADGTTLFAREAPRRDCRSSA